MLHRRDTQGWKECARSGRNVQKGRWKVVEVERGEKMEYCGGGG